MTVGSSSARDSGGNNRHTILLSHSGNVYGKDITTLVGSQRIRTRKQLGVKGGLETRQLDPQSSSLFQFYDANYPKLTDLNDNIHFAHESVI